MTASSHLPRINHSHLCRTLGLKSAKVPPDFEGVFPDTPVYEGPHDGDGPWAYLTLEVFPAETVKSRPSRKFGHRIYVVCKCGRRVPTGRYHQHLPACQSRAGIDLAELEKESQL